MSAVEVLRAKTIGPRTTGRIEAVPSEPAPFVTGSPAWRFVVLSVAAVASVATTIAVHVSGRNGLWGDEPSHLLQAHRFFDSLTPGFGQLGNYWPPLLHWAELPFAWNSWLVTTNLAGQIPAMVMFLVAVMGAYALGIELTGRRHVGALSALVLVANPNLLYLQSSTMMETGIIMTLTWVTVWLLRFRRTGRFRDVVYAGAWSALAVFATWAALVLPLYGGLIVARACRRNGFDWGKTKTFTAAYCLLSGYAVALWLGWNWYLQNDPLYMINYRHPEGLQPTGHTQLTQLHPDLGNGLLSLGSAALDNAGPAVFVLALAVLAVGVLRGKLLHPMGVALLGGVLIVAEWANGQGGLSGSPTFALLKHLDGRDAHGLNVRYALWIAPFMAGAVALAAGRRWWRQSVVAVLTIVSLAWFLPSFRGVVTLHSGDMVSAADEARTVAMAHRLRADYRGGEILTSASGGGDRVIWLSGLPARDFVTQFNAERFAAALRSPASAAAYVFSTPSLRTQIPDSTLAAEGFRQLWTTTIGGYQQTLWARPGSVAAP